MINQFKGKYSWLSNMAYIPPFIENGITYNTVENYYQAQKSDNLGVKLAISKLNPFESKSYGKKIKIVDDWNTKREDVMHTALKYKFNIPKFKNLLINTKDMEIIEGNYWGDKFWGVDLKTGDGLNILGNMIMSIRQDIYNTLDNNEYFTNCSNYTSLDEYLNKIDFKGHNKSVITYLKNQILDKYDCNLVHIDYELSQLNLNEIDITPISNSLRKFIEEVDLIKIPDEVNIF